MPDRTDHESRNSQHRALVRTFSAEAPKSALTESAPGCWILPTATNFSTSHVSFVRFGFNSVACGSSPDGLLDKETVMFQAQSRERLQNLRDRFSAIADNRNHHDTRPGLPVPVDHAEQVWVRFLLNWRKGRTGVTSRAKLPDTRARSALHIRGQP